MTTLTALCTFLAVGALLIILSTSRGRELARSTFQFLIDSPRPVGEGGGIGNAILGSLVLLLISSAFGLPLGICVGFTCRRLARGDFGGASVLSSTR
jgi:phosphate transport system permease protein